MPRSARIAAAAMVVRAALAAAALTALAIGAMLATQSPLIG
jgi:hypothetical protein